MIIRLSGTGSGAGNVDVTQIVPADIKIVAISISAYITIGAASTGGFAVPSFVVRGSPANLGYGLNAGAIDDGLLAAAMNYLTQNTANGNYPSVFEKLVTGLAIKMPKASQLSLRIVGAANATFGTEAVIYTA